MIPLSQLSAGSLKHKREIVQGVDALKVRNGRQPETDLSLSDRLPTKGPFPEEDRKIAFCNQIGKLQGMGCAVAIYRAAFCVEGNASQLSEDLLSIKRELAL